jgi:Thioredoxin
MIIIIEYGESNVIFCKIDVDKSKVAQSMGITSMPSFKIIKDAVEVLHILW